MNEIWNERDSPCTGTFTSLEKNTGKTTRRRRSKIKETISWSFIEYTETHEQYTYKRPIHAFKFIAWYLAYTDVFWKRFFLASFQTIAEFLAVGSSKDTLANWNLVGDLFGFFSTPLSFGVVSFRSFDCVCVCAWMWLYLKLTIFNHNCHDLVSGFWTYSNETEISKVFDDSIWFCFHFNRLLAIPKLVKDNSLSFQLQEPSTFMPNLCKPESGW